TLPACEPLEVLRVAYPTRAMDRVIAAAQTDKRCVNYPLDFGGGENQPPPRSTYMLLEAALPSEAELTVDRVPLVAGYLFVFGKETDREARLVFQLQRGERFDA